MPNVFGNVMFVKNPASGHKQGVFTWIELLAVSVSDAHRIANAIIYH
ncbi:MAG TPA: hypothetical protein VGI63_05765 [Verrucomicrobiae bacterium]|jgi:hypothetical protein